MQRIVRMNVLALVLQDVVLHVLQLAPIIVVETVQQHVKLFVQE